MAIGDSNATYCRSSPRYAGNPPYRGPNIGFRPALSVDAVKVASDPSLSVVPFPKDAQFTDARPVLAANQAGKINAYPWIAPDGLTLYWTREDQATGSEIYQATRPSPKAPFGSAMKVLGDARLASVSPDGLEIVCLADSNGDRKLTEFCQARRPSLTTAFTNIQSVPVFATGFVVKGSAFSDDSKALLILATPSGGNAQLYRSERSGPSAPWGTPRAVTIQGRPSEMHLVTWPSLVAGDTHLLFSYAEATKPGIEWGAVADATANPTEFINPRALLLDGERVFTRGGRYCAATGELFYTHPLEDFNFKQMEVYVAHVRDVPGASAPPPAVAPFDAMQAKQHQQAWADHLGEPVETTNSIGMKFVVIPPGEFKMGLGRNLVPVTLTHPFRLCVHEVTQGQWKAVMGTEPWLLDQDPKVDLHEGKDFPACHINWYQATEFCRKLTEQERAARTAAVRLGVPPSDRSRVGILLSCRIDDEILVR